MQSKQDSASDMSSNEKTRQIGEVLGLLEETHRGKDWILQEIKKHGIKISVKPTMDGYKLLNCCSHDFIATLLDALKGNDIIPPDGVQMKTYHWFFSDIVAGSNPSIPTKAQVSKIIALNNLIVQTQTFQERDAAATIILPTGDGQAIGFGDNQEKPLRLAIELHKALYRYNESKRGKEKLLLRIGIESGPVYFVKDLEGKNNVWGPGIIMTRRVMDLAGDTQIFAGGQIAEELVKQSPKYKDMMHLAQNYKTKYGEMVTTYNVFGEGFGNKSAPLKPKKTTNASRSVKASSNFTFNSIDVALKITNAKTMQTHHTWTWNVINISKKPISKIFYYLDGQVPKKFVDMNVKITDGDKNRQKISDITTDRPFHKEFHVILVKPLLPKQEIKLVLEYDWQEPERFFSYKFLSGAKKFKYSCMVPKEINLKNKVLKIDTGTGYRVHATPPSTIKRINNMAIISWEKSNIIPQDAYEFYW
ncbi:MAG TPA: hypothetical protein VFG24_06485 [Nitrosopumilaceae archaeon]|nr:hypothetical protein [Nitrosopumilaceae archaeon]